MNNKQDKLAPHLLVGMSASHALITGLIAKLVEAGVLADSDAADIFTEARSLMGRPPIPAELRAQAQTLISQLERATR